MSYLFKVSRQKCPVKRRTCPSFIQFTFEFRDSKIGPNLFPPFPTNTSPLDAVVMLQFLTTSRSENGYGFQRPGQKTGVENGIFWSETGSGFGEAGGTPPPRIPRSTPNPLRDKIMQQF